MTFLIQNIIIATSLVIIAIIFALRENIKNYALTKIARKRVITRGDSVPYLIRYTLFTCGLFSIKLHKALISDDETLHDHPWSYISFILAGGYYEETFVKKFPLDPNADIYFEEKSARYIQQSWKGPGSILFRRANVAHRLIIPKGEYSISLIITFRKKREWGFHTDEGWVPAQKHINQRL